MAQLYVITAPSGNNLNGLTADAVAAKVGGKVVDFAKTAGQDPTLDKAGCEDKLKAALGGATGKVVLLNYMGVQADSADLFAAAKAQGSVEKVIFAFAGSELERLTGEAVVANVETKRKNFAHAESNGISTVKVEANGNDADAAAFAKRVAAAL